VNILIQTRFSIIDFDKKSRWTRARAMNDADYREHLYSPARLEEKFRAFETFTLPSVIAQTWANWRWDVFAGASLPSPFRERLAELAACDPRIAVHWVGSLGQMGGIVDSLVDEHQGIPFGTMRLDDDDAIPPVTCLRMQEYAESGAGNPTVVGFRSYDLVCFGPDEAPSLCGRRNRSYPQPLGLTCISGDISRLGNHTKVHLREDVTMKWIDDVRPLLYCGPSTSTGRMGKTPPTPFDMAAWLARKS
jgi:hypothetical protein